MTECLPLQYISYDINGPIINYDRYRVAILYVDTLGNYLSPILEHGNSDLLCGFYRAKFTFPKYFNGVKICL